MKSIRLKQLSPRTILIGTFFVFLWPFLMVELFPLQFDKVMDVGSWYIAFHNTAEFFSIMVSLSVFSIGWYTYDQSKDRQALFLAVAFLAVGLVDFMHTMANVAMPAFLTPNSTNKSTQFWLVARLLSASSFLVSAFIYPETRSRWLSKSTLMTVALVISGLAFTGFTFFPAYLPATAIPGVGITPLKRVAEFLVIILLLLAGVAYWKRMVRTGNRLLIYYLSAFIICIFSEGVFASYKTGFDTYNVLGHIYKVIAFYLIYKGIFMASVRAPYVKLIETGKELLVHRNHLEDLVKERTSQLERANKDLESFSYSVSHDLRSPLRAIAVSSRMLENDLKECWDEEAKRRLGMIDRNAAKMNQLIDDLLAFSRLGSQEINKSVIDMKELATRVWNDLPPVNPDREMTVAISPLPAGYGDQNLIGQILANLLSNAVKFTKNQSGAAISVGGREDTDVCIYYVQDNGAGFDMQYQDKLFGIFQRLHDKDYEGTGVGLSIVKRIVERHGGRVWAEGKENEGATFYFTLPRKETD